MKRVLLVVAILVGVIGLIWLAATRLHGSGSSRVSYTPRQLNLAVPSGFQLVENSCYDLIVPSDYSTRRDYGGCMVNLYSRPRKDNWLNIDSYTEKVADLEVLEKVFVARKLSTDQKIVSRDKLTIDGYQAIKLVDEFESNHQHLATVLVLAPNKHYLDGQSTITAFELRGQYETDEDKQIFDQAASNWRWR